MKNKAAVVVAAVPGGVVEASIRADAAARVPSEIEAATKRAVEEAVPDFVREEWGPFALGDRD